MNRTLALAALAALALPALAPAALADAPAPAIDNGRVTVRDVMLTQGEPGPAITHAGDYVVLYMNGGRIARADGKTQRPCRRQRHGRSWRRHQRHRAGRRRP